MNFNTTREEMDTILAIVERVAEIAPDADRLVLTMDLSACHSNGCPLDFGKLLAFPSADFTHDIAGIRRHIDRSTGQLGDCFTPRCAKPEGEA